MNVLPPGELIHALKWRKDRMMNALYHNDVSAVRAFLIGASLAWGGWLFIPGNSLELPGLRMLNEIFQNEYLLSVIPISAAVGRFITSETFGLFGLRMRFIADAIASGWWLALTVSLLFSNALIPGIGVYGLMTVFSLWVLWRDVPPRVPPGVA